MEKVRIGAIGLGRLGYAHAKNIAFRIPGAELTALCDMNEDKLNQVCDEWKVPYRYTDFEEMINNDDLDAVVITSPSHLHTKQIALALDKGLHVFSEKPLGTSVEECKIAEEAVEAHPNKVFMLGFMRRYDPSYAYAKKMVDSGEIGRPILLEDTPKILNPVLMEQSHTPDIQVVSLSTWEFMTLTWPDGLLVQNLKPFLPLVVAMPILSLANLKMEIMYQPLCILTMKLWLLSLQVEQPLMVIM